MENSSSLKEKKVVLKKDIVVLPVWLGKRLSGFSDYEGFESALCSHGLRETYAAFMIPNAEEMKDAFPYLGQMELDIKRLMNKIKAPLVVFFIITPRAAELVWLDPLIERLQGYRQKWNKRDDVFFYKIIMGGGMDFSTHPSYKTQSSYWDYERRSSELGDIFSYFNSDAPTNGYLRLVELMNRIIGGDLPGEEFPDYSLEELMKMAWNINREDFNLSYPKVGAIPKYKIGENGRPIFPDLE